MKKGIISILALVVIIIVIIIIIENKKKYDEDNVQPIIYYSIDDVAKIPLIEESTFASNVRISWSANCLGKIKKDGKDFSQEIGTTLDEDGSYEISVSSPSGKNKTVQTLKIDKTPPKVELKENEAGYTIIFDDISDVAVATLTRLEAETRKLVEEIDLMEGGLKQNFEVKETGYYVLKVEDELGNALNTNTKFKIE